MGESERQCCVMEARRKSCASPSAWGPGRAMCTGPEQCGQERGHKNTVSGHGDNLSLGWGHYTTLFIYL
jgi:hypothetical protein